MATPKNKDTCRKVWEVCTSNIKISFWKFYITHFCNSVIITKLIVLKHRQIQFYINDFMMNLTKKNPKDINANIKLFFLTFHLFRQIKYIGEKVWKKFNLGNIIFKRKLMINKKNCHKKRYINTNLANK